MAKAKRYGGGPIHEQVEIDVRGRTITCDRGVVKLLKSLDKAGVKTLYSCQGSWGYDIPYVAMERPADIGKVRSIVKAFWKNCVIFENDWFDDRVCYYAMKSKFQIKNAERFTPSLRNATVIAGKELLNKEAL